MDTSPFFPVVKLLLRCIPSVAQETCFALKGGTAINLFVRDMPRLSVDIDLAYLPLDARDVALKNVSAALERIASTIQKTVPGSTIQRSKTKDGLTVKLFVSLDGHTIKIEPNPVIRGSAFAAHPLTLVPKAEKLFQMSAKIASLNAADLYGGKLCASLDRQHPRDLFDIKLLLENEGITAEIRRAFLVYLASHARPMHELLAPKPKDLTKTYASEFVAMAEREVSLDELLKTREQFIAQINTDFTNDERRFLLSIKEGSPDWPLLGVPGAENLPALQWKLANIRQMKDAKRQKQAARLKAQLGL
jgi:hypothetical protein